MIKIFRIFVMPLVAVLCIFGCAKEIDFSQLPGAKGGDETSGNTGDCRLVKVIADLGEAGGFNAEFSYDATGRLTQSTRNFRYQKFTYSTNLIETVDQDDAHAQINLLNGRAESSTVTNFVDENGVTKDLSRKYTYDSEGYLILIEWYEDGKLNSKHELSYANGNLMQIKSTLEQEGRTELVTFEYSSELTKDVRVYERFDPIYRLVDYCPGNYFGKASKNVLTKSTSLSTYTSSGNKRRDETTLYAYKYTKTGKPEQVTMTIATNDYYLDGTKNSNSFLFKYNMVYSCK